MTNESKSISLKHDKNRLFVGMTFFIIILSCNSCSKWVQVGPPITSLSGNSIYSTDAAAASVLTGIYADMSNNTYQFVTGLNSISLIAGLSSDEFTLFGGSSANTDFINYYSNNLSSGEPLTFWTPFYQTLIQINSAIEGLKASTSLTPSVEQQLLGEAFFLRGFIYFQLVNLYGNVPLVLTSDYKFNATIPTSPSTIIWQQIISDLNVAKDMLSPSFLDATVMNTTNERVRPTSWAATALLAKSYLYTEKWDSAELNSSVVINSPIFSLDSINDVFLKNSTESIWQLQPVISGQNTIDANTFVLASGPNTYANPVYLSDWLLNAFEPGDERYSNWIGLDTSTGAPYYYPYKYKSVTYNAGSEITEYLMVLRLADQYLIRAEAKAHQSKLDGNDGALHDVNIIRTRAGLPSLNTTDESSLISKILHERRVEYFSEWGNRWFDLKRSGTVDSVMNIVTPAKGGNWLTTKQLYPVPLYDIQQDENITQNPGY